VSVFRALGARRPAAAPAPARGTSPTTLPLAPPRSAGAAVARPRSPRLLVLVPLGLMVMLGLLVIALSWMVGGLGPAPTPPPARADVDVELTVPVIDETEVGETMVRLGPAFMR